MTDEEVQIIMTFELSGKRLVKVNQKDKLIEFYDAKFSVDELNDIVEKANNFYYNV